MPYATIVVLALLLAPFATSVQSQNSVPHHVVPLHTFSAGQWVEKVSGDFSKPGEQFVFRIHQDAGYITLPHVHPIDEHITVVKGTWSILQIHGIGPFASTVVEPVYELTDQGVFSLTSLLLPGRPTSSSPPECFALKVNDKVRGDAGEGGERFWAMLQQLQKR
jgi:hypothetical protein